MDPVVICNGSDEEDGEWEVQSLVALSVSYLLFMGDVR